MPRDCCSPAPCYTNLFCCVDIVDICPTLLAASAGDAISDRVTRACTGWSEFSPVPDNIGAAVAAARRRAAAASDTAPCNALKPDDTIRNAARPQRHAATADAAHRTAHRIDLWV